MPNYRIIGGDQKQYGPVSADELRQWIAEGRLNGQTPAQAEGATEWKPLSQFQEFAEALGAAPTPAGPPKFAENANSSEFGEQLGAHDYNLEIGGCISRGWELLKNNFGTVFGGGAVYLLIQIAISALGNIPIVGPLISLANIVFVAGPMLGGVYYFLLKNIRHQPVEIGDIFAGFHICYWQLVLGYLVMTFIAVLLAIPGGVIMAISIVPMARNQAVDATHIAMAAVGFLVLLIPLIYVGVSWLFALPLIIDKQMNFWAAMTKSRQMVSEHWWTVFGFLMVCGLVNCAGIIVCCLGLFVTIPIVFGALMYAYEDVFNPPATPTT
jgi:uncharacterized membrane protein